MTDTRKLEDQNPENKSKVTEELTDGELNQVSGGGQSAQGGGQNDPKQLWNAIMQQLGPQG